MVSAQYNLILMYEEGRISPEDIAPLLASANNQLQQLPPDDYLLQIIATPSREALDRYVKANKSALQQQQLLVAAIRRDDKDWHVLFFRAVQRQGKCQASAGCPTRSPGKG